MIKDYKIYKVYFEYNKTIFVLIDITKQNLKNRLYTHRHYSKKTGKYKNVFRNKDIFIDLVEENTYKNRKEAKEKSLDWKYIYANMENVKLIENTKNKKEIQKTTKIISCECGSKLKYNSYLAHIRNKKHICYMQNKDNNKFESFVINFD